MSAPSRLAVYRALCALSPRSYATLAELILAIAEAQRVKNTRRSNRRYLARAGNIGKPVITVGGDGEGA